MDREKKIGFARAAGEIGKAAGIALIVSLVSVLLLALLIRFAGLGEGAVRVIDQIVKVLAVFLGCFLSVRERGGLVKGLIAGLLSMLLTYLVFALISGSFADVSGLVWDALFGMAAGAISSVAAVNLKKG